VSKSLSFVVGMAAVLLAAPARALPTWATYSAVLGGSAVGGMRFDFDEEVAEGCRYVASWDFGAGVAEEQCTVDESKSFGHSDCLRNAEVPVPGLVVTAAGEPCWGIDGTGQSNSVFTLILSERGSDGSLSGVIQLDTATSSVSSFHATPSS